MRQGHLDAVTTLGFVEGWAFDPEAPAQPLEVAVIVDHVEVAWGLAHRFRMDLWEAQLGLGWCAFRLKLDVEIDDVSFKPVSLVERTSGTELAEVSSLVLIDDPEVPATALRTDVVIADPTVIAGVWQLKHCDPLFMAYIAAHGIDAFLSEAYAYMLGRPVDESALDYHTRCIRQASVTPCGVLEELEKSAEFRDRPRALAAPTAYCFPFALT